MQINNPGILDGSVTTAKIADGAVATAKCSTTDFLPEYTGNLVLKNSSIEMQTLYGGSVLYGNPSSVFYWEMYHAGHDVQGALVLKNDVSGNLTFQLNTDDTVSLFNPLPEGSGGTGAASLLAAGIPTIISHKSGTGLTANTGNILLASAPATGIYRVNLVAFMNTASGSGFFSPTATATHGGTSVEYDEPQLSVGAAAPEATGKTFVVFADTGTDIYGAIGANGWTAFSYDYDMTLERMV